jgi:glycopeptide antibiotics resistance protein
MFIFNIFVNTSIYIVLLLINLNGGINLVLEFNLTILGLFILAYILFRVLIIIISKHIDIEKETLNLFLFLSIIPIIAATMFPIRFGVEYKGFEIYNLIPLKVPINIYNNHSFEYFLYQTVGNFMLFIPFGFFSYCRFKSIKKAILLSLAMTLSVEIIQGFIPYRFCEIDDVWLNTSGGSFGSCVAYSLNLFSNLISKNTRSSDIKS